MAAPIVGAQLAMVPVAITVGRHADRRGHKPILLAAFASGRALNAIGRGVVAAVGAVARRGRRGEFGALVPVVVATLTRGSERFNATQGAVA